RRAMRKVIGKSGYRRRKEDARRKVARMIVAAAEERGYGIALEDLGRRPNERMIRDISNPQLRYRIFQAAFRGIQMAMEEEAMELGVPVVHVNPRNTSRMCPVHRTPIVYDGSRVGRCSGGGELWHRDVAAAWNILRRALGGDGSAAPSPLGLSVDGRPMPLASTAAHDPTVIARDLWARCKSLPLQTATIQGGLKR
ncbi:MAG: IS200/IS605 family accessory protein TnpB-related protein, partial [Conexivisphaera sp.]